MVLCQNARVIELEVAILAIDNHRSIKLIGLR